MDECAERRDVVQVCPFDPRRDKSLDASSCFAMLGRHARAWPCCGCAPDSANAPPATAWVQSRLSSPAPPLRSPPVLAPLCSQSTIVQHVSHARA